MMSGGAYTYRNLALWQKAQELTLEIVKLASALPEDRVAPTLGRQVVRSASSIGANIAEGHGRFTLAAHRNHLSIAKGSACETDGSLDPLRRAGYLAEQDEERMHAACPEIISMLTAKILNLERQEAARGGKRISEGQPTYGEVDILLDQPGSRF